MDKQRGIIGIDLGAEKVYASYFDTTCIDPMIIATINGYEALSESSIDKVFNELKQKIGNVEAVIAIPAYFNIIQRKMIRDSGEQAEISIKRFVHKTSAAAVAVEFDRIRKQQKRSEAEIIAVCVFDKGLFEIALAELGEGIIEIKAVDWAIDFDKVNIDGLRFNGLCTSILAKQQYTIEQIDSIILAGDSTYLTEAHQLALEYFKKEPSNSFNIEHTIAIGMSMQGAIMGGSIKDMLLMEVTSMSLGIEASNGTMTKIIPRNTTIPTRISKLLPIQTNSSTININLLQGESEIASQNLPIGNLCLDVKRILGGKVLVLIEVTMDINANGVIKIEAKEVISRKEKNTVPIYSLPIPWWMHAVGGRKYAEKIARDYLLKEDPNFNDLPKKEQKELIAKEIERRKKLINPFVWYL